MTVQASLNIYEKNEFLFRTQLLSYLQGPIALASYTVATLPAAATYANSIIYVSDGTSNKRLAVSDGTNWRFPDGNIVS